jgi:hypothetical protein
MDLIFRLQLAFLGQVYYLRGNHDSFAEEISKFGVPQGVLWEHALRDDRGAAYFEAMCRLYQRLPYVITSPRFVACHAGPPTSSVSRDELINVRDNPRLMRELTWMRLRKPSSPAGYGPGDVKRLRKALGLVPRSPSWSATRPCPATKPSGWRRAAFPTTTWSLVPIRNGSASSPWPASASCPCATPSSPSRPSIIVPLQPERGHQVRL